MNEKTQSTETQTPEQKEELAAYEKLRQRVKQSLAEVRETVNADNIRQVVDKAGTQLKEVGEHTAEAINKATQALKKDLSSVANKLEPKWEAFAEKTDDLFEAWRDRSSVFLGQASRAIGDWLQGVGTKLEHQTYRTGEMSYGGTFECTACGERVELPKAGHLPPCPKCSKTEFQRI